MADDDVGPPGGTPGPAPHDAEGPTATEDGVTAEQRPTEVAVVRVGDPPAVQWRERALAVRAAVPQLARNPVVVGASAAVATVALRLAVDAAQRALGASASSRPQSLAVTGSIRHEVNVVRQVHVIHHVVHHVVHHDLHHDLHRRLPPWSRWPPP
jgi:hypothetical protein